MILPLPAVSLGRRFPGSSHHNGPMRRCTRRVEPLIISSHHGPFAMVCCKTHPMCLGGACKMPRLDPLTVYFVIGCARRCVTQAQMQHHASINAHVQQRPRLLYHKPLRQR
jgi:hypothetical protein